MKHIILPGTLLILLWVALFPSCAPDNSTTNAADNRDKFLGTWNVSEAHTKMTPAGELKMDIFYQVHITADPNSLSAVYIYNFANAGQSVTAHAETNNEIIFISPSNQTLSTNWIVDGSGGMSGSVINWNFTINDGADLIYATAKYSR